ncbi:MAG TPA: LysR family substrate-binding domain-containing protein [Pseudonocardiaceae bacterium]|jgi:DNA-binding transcriptional LysR family regulator|nr:LysR family substrate-binding domain-containing protein [Pseudonocardiaceae bacterium]
MTGGSAFRLGYVPGVTPSKWLRIWAERLPDVPLTLVQALDDQVVGLVRDGGVDAALLRLPIDRTDLHAIPLYTETTVVVLPKEHQLAAADEVTVADLAEEVVLHPCDDVLEWTEPPGLRFSERPVTTAHAIGMVAAEVGLLLVPQSLARLHHRKDLTYRLVTDAVQSAVALVWPSVEETSDLVEQFIGIVRGRTVNSTRGRAAAPSKAPRTARKSAPVQRRTGRHGKPRR